MDKLDKFAIAAALQEISSLLELKGGVSRFKARAYQTGARAIAAVAADVGKLIEDNRLTSIPGIGNALASQIKELHLTGSSSVLKGLRKEFPPGIIELSGLPGLSIAKISKLHEILGVTSIAQLQAAAAAGRVRNVKGFGAKTEQRLLEVIANHDREHKTEKRFHLHHAQRIGEQTLNYIRAAPGLEEVSFAGSLRRWKETVGTIRIVASSKQPADLVEHFLRFPLIVKDMEPRWIREARKRKIKFVISVDAHSTPALNNLKYGVGMARRGWVRRGEVLNTLNLKAFQKAVRPV